jgi:hypothetical protein
MAYEVENDRVNYKPLVEEVDTVFTIKVFIVYPRDLKKTHSSNQ